MSCPICSSSVVVERVGAKTFQYSGTRLTIDGFHYSVCGRCCEEFVTTLQAKHSDKLVADAKRKHDLLLSSADLVEAREGLGLSQVLAARIFGGGQNSFSKYERGEVLQSRSMDLLVRVAKEVPDAANWLKSYAGISDISDSNKNWLSIGEYATHACSVTYVGSKPAELTDKWVPLKVVGGN